MLITVIDDRTNTTRILKEYQSLVVGRCPPDAEGLSRLEIGGGGEFDSLSAHAVTITNNDDRAVIMNRQNAGAGSVWVYSHGPKWQSIGPDDPFPIHPMPTTSVVKIELYGEPSGTLRLVINARGMVMAPHTHTTRDMHANAAVQKDWVLAVNAVECNNRAGTKMTFSNAKKYFLGYKNQRNNSRLFEAAYQTAAEILTGDPGCSMPYLLSKAAHVLDERLIKRLIEMEVT